MGWAYDIYYEAVSKLGARKAAEAERTTKSGKSGRRLGR